MPEATVSKPARWKRWFWISFGTASGITLILATTAAVVLWYTSRPKPPRPWNKSAVTATFERLSRTSKGDIILEFVATNHTSEDYRVISADQLDVMARHRRGGLVQGRDALAVDTPIFIPAGQTVTISVTMRGYRDPGAPETRDEAVRFIHTTWKNFVGFTLFDESMRYQIELTV